MEEDPILEYTQLFEKKRKLLEEKQTIDQRLVQLKSVILKHGENNNQFEFELNDVEKYGPLGSIQLKEKREYEIISRARLTRLCSEFYKFLCPETSDEDCLAFGKGQCDWIWTNRKFSDVKYINRFYADKVVIVKNDRKRKTPDNSEEIEKVPKTQLDFIKSSIFLQFQKQ